MTQLTLTPSWKHGADLQIGDVIRAPFTAKRITRLDPYEGKALAYLGEGARIARFATGGGMTITPDGRYEVCR